MSFPNSMSGSFRVSSVEYGVKEDVLAVARHFANSREIVVIVVNKSDLTGPNCLARAFLFL